ncbi:lysophospholipid acyltransferase family protein [soil metagenome]
MSKRNSTLRKLRHAIAVRVARAALIFTPRLSLEHTQSFGAALGSVAARLPGKRRARVMENLRLAFPEKSASWRQHTLVECFRSMGRLAMEGPWLGAWNEAAEMARYRVADPERLARTLKMAAENGRGLIIFGAHMGAIELGLPYLARKLGAPVATMAAKPKIPELAADLTKLRELSGVRQFYRGEGATAAIRHVIGGGVLIMVVDHNIKGEGMDIPFFGRDAHTLLAPARLALQVSATVNTIFVLRDGPGRYVLECGEPFVAEKLSKDSQDKLRQQAALALEYTKRIEDVVRRYPGQFMWMHRRWEKRSGTLPFPRS